MGIMDIGLKLLLGLIVSAVFTYLEIPILKKKQFKQYIREEGPESHQKKSGTPTMGGLAMILALVITTFLWRGFNVENLVMVIITLLFGAIGFLDDYIKVAEKHNLGLRAWQKLVLQFLFGIGLAIYVAKSGTHGTEVYIPFYGDYVDFGWFYIPFVTFVIVAMANSVNLTDGLDGLCSGVTAITAIAFSFIGLNLNHAAPATFCATLSGVCLGFLIFNKNPAKLFMGDTGSMALGGALASAAILMKMEFLLVIAGFVYVMESLSVIIQVISFQTTGKRVFIMSPIHHHFELGGMSEKSVVVMFWGIALACSLLAYLVFRI